MELALYCPKHGYYETKKDNPGRHGDFYTSVGVGKLFGQLLAFQFAEWLETLNPQPSTLNLVEAGAHDGQLARDILTWLQLNRPELFDLVEYRVIEPSPRRQEWQKKTLEQYSSHVRWFTNFHSIATNNSQSATPTNSVFASTRQSRCREHATKVGVRNPQLNGVVFSNELLDAMPVHRFGWDAQNKKWFEWGVALEGERFVWTRLPATFPSSIFHLPSSPELLAVLPDGYTIETCPVAENWWRKAANILERGRLLTIDYGLTADELILPSRPRGTLRAYFRHHAGDDLLANVGEQDLTAHVNFSAIRAVGESAGLKTETFSTQSQFLTQILEKTLREKSFGEWTSAQVRQFQTLTHPEHLGRAFRVLVQSR
jgi:SAM-dependent MidA family methyltransferase